ncbi:MAG: carbon-nitrogen hydrolase family protein [Planctomycetota bacterium]|nr:MAG: carbon-nitrogen hydrolase family protein [Planctomycetota bacterium]
MKIAGVQMDITLRDNAGNVSRMIDHLSVTARDGVGLTIFPECAVPGYCFSSLQEALPYAESMDGRSVGQMAAACRELNTHAVFGMLERDGDRVFNVAVLAGPRGVEAVYRKVHLPYLGIDMFTTPGDRPFAVHEVNGLRIGMLICYDAAFPEAARSLALLGADLIVLPTNWPPGAELMASCSIPCRAMENQVYFAAVNRVGEEQGFTFIGESSLCAPHGQVLARASGSSAAVITAEVDPLRSRQKRIVRVPDKHIIDRMADRRPEMYGLLVEPHHLSSPRVDYQGQP